MPYTISKTPLWKFVKYQALFSKHSFLSKPHSVPAPCRGTARTKHAPLDYFNIFGHVSHWSQRIKRVARISSQQLFCGSKCGHGVTTFPSLPTRTDRYYFQDMTTRDAFGRTFGFGEQELDAFGSRQGQDIVLGIRDDILWRGESSDERIGREELH